MKVIAPPMYFGIIGSWAITSLARRFLDF